MLAPDVPGSEQVIVVSHGRLAAFERQADGWDEVFMARRAFVGRAGIVPGATRRQGTGTTPAGTFSVVSAFGRLPDPGTRLTYRRVDRTDSWVYDPRRPRVYNTWQERWPRSPYAERLWDYRVRYRYALVLDYNLPPADVRAGGGIFVHVDIGRPTSGCVAVSQRRMRALLRWLDPAADPVVVIREP